KFECPKLPEEEKAAMRAKYAASKRRSSRPNVYDNPMKAKRYKLLPADVKEEEMEHVIQGVASTSLKPRCEIHLVTSIQRMDEEVPRRKTIPFWVCDELTTGDEIILGYKAAIALGAMQFMVPIEGSTMEKEEPEDGKVEEDQVGEWLQQAEDLAKEFKCAALISTRPTKVAASAKGMTREQLGQQIKETLNSKHQYCYSLLLDIHCRYAHVFDLSELPPARYPAFGIKLIEGEKVPKSHLRQIPWSRGPMLQAELDRLKKLGTIEEIKHETRYVSAIVLVPKGDGVRLCVDYRPLNKATMTLHRAVARVDEVVRMLHGKKLFIILDLKSGYHQVEIEESSKEYTTFITKFGTFQYKRMPFGLKNAPAYFTMMLDDILAGLVVKGQHESKRAENAARM
ncbi:hypothetical protein ADUPG1_000518, partial [Aduncisulcus paluster]